MAAGLNVIIPEPGNITTTASWLVSGGSSSHWDSELRAQYLLHERISKSGGLGSKEVADDFVEALRKLEEDRNVESLVDIHTENCEVGNVSIETLRSQESSSTTAGFVSG